VQEVRVDAGAVHSVYCHDWQPDSPAHIDVTCEACKHQDGCSFL
jgi:hypothetical protein